MKRDKIFPAVIVESAARKYRAAAGLRLESILKNTLVQRDLALDIREAGKYDGPGTDPCLINTIGIEALLQAISGWPNDTSLELKTNANPDLSNRPQSRLTISIIIRTTGRTREEAMEKTISRFLALAGLLPTHLPEAGFIPITDRRELVQTLAPFKTKTALTVQRRAAAIALTQPLRQASTVGFNQEEAAPGNGRSQTANHVFPWKPAADTWRRLLDTLLAQLDPLQLVVRIKKASAKDKRTAVTRLEQTILDCERFLSADRHAAEVLRCQAELLRNLSLSQLAGLQEYGFRLGVYLMAAGRLDPTLGQVLGSAITTAATIEKPADILYGGFRQVEINPEKATDPDYFHETEPFTLQETAAAFRLPAPPAENQLGLPVKNFRTSLARLPVVDPQKEAITLAVNQHWNMSQPIRATADDRMRHTFIIGQTGTGKSTMMESMILQDIRAGRGVAVIDPHGEMVEGIIGKIPPKRQEDIVYFNLLDREKPPGFNLLRWTTIEERDMIIDELYLTIDGLYNMREAGGPIFEQYFRGMLRLLMGDRQNADFIPTLLEVGNCFQSQSFRNWLKARTSDPQTKDFLEQAEKAGGDATLANITPYITSKLTRFIQDRTIQRIIGQNEITVDFEKVMNSGKILLMNLGKGRLGSTVSALIANQVVARFKQAAMKRGAMEAAARRDFFLYVDECHNLPAGSFSELLAEARKYRLGLVLATQYTAQLKKTAGNELSGNLLEAIIGNVGTILVFRVGNVDAETMAPLLQPSFSKEDIIGLPNWHGYGRLQPGGEATPPLSFIGIRDEQPYCPSVARQVWETSRGKYGTEAGKVDLQIQKRRLRWKYQ